MTDNPGHMSTETKSLAAKITPGVWKVRDTTEVYGAGYFIGSTKGNGPLPPSVMAQDAANAELIAEAGTVTNETGMSPRELVDKLMEAVGLVERSRNEAMGATFIQDRQDFLSTLTLPADEH